MSLRPRYGFMPGRLPGTLSLLGEILKTFVCLSIAGLLANDLWAYLLVMLAPSWARSGASGWGGPGAEAQTMFVTGFLVLCPVAMAWGL